MKGADRDLIDKLRAYIDPTDDTEDRGTIRELMCAAADRLEELVVGKPVALDSRPCPRGTWCIMPNGHAGECTEVRRTVHPAPTWAIKPPKAAKIEES